MIAELIEATNSVKKIAVKMKCSYIFGSFLLAALLNFSNGDSEGNVTTSQLETHTNLQVKSHECPMWFIPSSNNSGCKCGELNRDGRMCHKCKPGYRPAVLSYEVKCLKCDTAYGWLLYLLLACLPTTLLFFMAIVCKVRISSASMNAFVFLSNVSITVQ